MKRLEYLALCEAARKLEEATKKIDAVLAGPLGEEAEQLREARRNAGEAKTWLNAVTENE